MMSNLQRLAGEEGVTLAEHSYTTNSRNALLLAEAGGALFSASAACRMRSFSEPGRSGATGRPPSSTAFARHRLSSLAGSNGCIRRYR